MDAEVIQFVLPALIGGAVVVVGKAMDILNTYVSKKQGKHVDKATLQKALSLQQELLTEKLETAFSNFLKNRILCTDVLELKESHISILSQMENLQEEIRKNGEITSSSLMYLIREKEYKNTYINLRREVKKYFKDGTTLFRFAVIQSETIESLAFKVCEDYLNTKIVNQEDIALMENQAVNKFDDLNKKALTLLGEELYKQYAVLQDSLTSEYVKELRFIFTDKENDKIQRVHTLSITYIEKVTYELRDAYIRKLKGGKDE